MSRISIGKRVVGPIQANCYILGCPETGQAVIIDPGEDADDIAAYVQDKKLRPARLVNTHGHFDHIGANKALKELYPEVQVCIHKDDAPMLGKPLKNFSVIQGMWYKSPQADVLLEDGSVVECGSIRLEVVHTPGHTPGGICLVLGSDKPTRIFSGDTLFAGGVGRTDFPGGDWDRLLKSIRTRLFSYPDDTIVFPGHGPQTTVGEERRSNPYLS